MVMKNNTRGFFDWIAQRVSAVVIGAYAVFLFSFFALHHPLHYSAWNALFSSVWMRVATVIVTVAILWHAWIGLWTVFTDYVKCGYARLFLLSLLAITLLGYLAWCLDAFW